MREKMAIRVALFMYFVLFGLAPCFSVEFELYDCPGFEDVTDGQCSFTVPTSDQESTPLPPQRRSVVKVDSVCYDWYDDELAYGKLRSSVCDDAHFRCCLEYQDLKIKDETKCADKIPYFLKSWTAIGFTYQLWGMDSKKFAEILVKFLRDC